MVEDFSIHCQFSPLYDVSIREFYHYLSNTYILLLFVYYYYLYIYLYIYIYLYTYYVSSKREWIEMN